MLHMDIVQERLEREYDMDLITTAPTVIYEVVLTDGTVERIENPSRMPEQARIAEIREPIVKVVIFVPQESWVRSSRCAPASAASSAISPTMAAPCISPTSCR